MRVGVVYGKIRERTGSRGHGKERERKQVGVLKRGTE